MQENEMQVKAAQIISEEQVYLEDAMLDALAVEKTAAEAAAFLSVNALLGSQNPKTIRLRAMVDNKVMLLLVDSGSSHTFIDQQLAYMLQCPTSPLHVSLRVKVANGEFMQCEQEVHGFKWWIQGHTFITDMKFVPLGGYDAILGMDWLEKWGPMTCHWEEKWIQFQHNEQLITLQGLHDKPVTQIKELTAEQLEKCLKGSDVWATAVLAPEADLSVQTTPESVQELLTEYSDVFQKPQQLAPHRAFDHAVPPVT